MMMKIRYKVIKKTVNNLFINLNINTYPISLLKLYSNFDNCRVVSYSKHMKKYNLTEDEVFEHFGSDEGCTFYNFSKQRYLVFYNDLNKHYKTPARRRWTLAHELGHILLNHHIISNKTIIFRNTITNEEYNWMEKEANRFAALLLANPIILHKLNIKNDLEIAEICKLSDEASKYRYKDYLRWKKHKYINADDLIVIANFYNFIYKKYCRNCGYGLVSDNATYCPVCGQKLKWGLGKVKYKEGVKLNKDGKALVCPNCSNEEISEYDMYCKICGAYLYQECLGIRDMDCNGDEYIVKKGCGVILDSNARYCTQCGCKTTFYKYLKSWEEEKQEAESELHNDEVAATTNIDEKEDKDGL